MSDDGAALVLLARHLGVTASPAATSIWNDIKAAVEGLSDDRLDASIRFFGQAGSSVTDLAAEKLTDLMLARMIPASIRQEPDPT